MRIAFLGDIAVFEDGLLGSSWEKAFSEVAYILHSHDLVIANLEVPLTEIKHTMVCKGIHLRSSAKIVPFLKHLNVGAVCLANNHICDFGLKGMEDTLNALETAGIPYYGVNGRNWLYEDGAEKINFHGFCCYSTNGAHYIEKPKERGVNSLRYADIKACLKTDRQNEFLSVLSLHWGDEYSHLPNEKQVEFVHEMSRVNSFILHGHHAHVIQGIEKAGDSLSIYNQGNFCFDECRSPVNPKLAIRQSSANRESYIVSVNVEDGKIGDWETIGIFYDEYSMKIIQNQPFIRELSGRIVHCKEEAYKEDSRRMIREQKSHNLAPHDLKWLISKLNYYSLGAKLLTYRNKKKYERAMSTR